MTSSTESAWTTTGIPSACAAPQRLDVADVVELERSRDVDRAGERELGHLAARRPEPALPARHSSTVSPGAGATSSMPAGSSSRSASGVPVSSGKVAVVARDTRRRADELGGHGRLARAHREVVADREHGDVGGVDPADQRHVAEDVRVAGEVERRRRPASRPRSRTTRRCRRRRSDDEWFACVSVTRDPSRSTPPPLLSDCAHVRRRSPPPRSAAQLDLRDHGAGERAREPDRVADVVGVAVGDEDRVDALRLELGRGAATGCRSGTGST